MVSFSYARWMSSRDMSCAVPMVSHAVLHASVLGKRVDLMVQCSHHVRKKGSIWSGLIVIVIPEHVELLGL